MTRHFLRDDDLTQAEQTAIQNEAKTLEGQRATLDQNTFETRAAALQALASVITPGGVLILGESESAAEAGPVFRGGAAGLFQRDPAVAA